MAGAILMADMNVNLMLMNQRSRGTAGPELPPRTALATLPADLRQWVNESVLVGWVLELVADALEGHAPAASIVEDGPPAATMLTVLTYCYATARYGFDEIESATATDRTIHYLCAGHFVTSSTIRRFRRVHRVLLHACLTRLLRRAWRHRFGRTDLLEESNLPSARSMGSADDSFTYRLAAVAEQKIQQAILADSMALDV
jgi:hypothetical protein